MWIKHGRIFYLDESPNRSTHAQVPTPYVMQDRIRIFYSCRNNGKAFVTYFDLAKDLKTILYSHKKPVFEHGNPGMFDADGVMPSCVIENNGELWLYYIGWSELKNTARYQNEIGIAVSKDKGETFERMFKGPIIGRSMAEPGLAVMPYVMYKNWFRLWHQSLVEWIKVDDKYEPIYVIKYADSIDGVNWKRHPAVCIQQNNPLEAFSRPSVIFQDDMYKCWYCFRDSKDYRGGKGSYRIGYADSTDGVNFIRKDYESGIKLGEEGEWDSESQCYPYVFECDGRMLMLYNGNDFGQTGIGLCVWE